MRIAIALASTVLVVSAIAGALVALQGSEELAWLIWIAGSIGSASIAFCAPWLIHLFGRPQ